MATIQKPIKWQGRDDLEEPSPAQRWHHRVVLSPTDDALDPAQCCGLIGFACDAGVTRNRGRSGAAAGPAALREQLRNLSWHGGDRHLIDFGNVVVEDDGLEAGHKLLATQVADALAKVARLLVVGGGHETAFGSFSGLHKALGADTKIGIINLDAHFDLRRPGPAGPSSGTPFFQIEALSGADNFHYFCLGVAKETNAQALFQRADDWAVRYRLDTEMSMTQLAQIKAELAAFTKPLDALYLTIDMDVLPHYQAPGVSAPAVRGVAFEVIEAVIGQVIECAQDCRFGLPLVELTELNPSYDLQGVTARTAAVLASALLKNDF
ncbi:MAG: formimidoylglutamase [Magnetovibrio sp.]|nr:formimidoylglutamase [Magnetovibrio sp.]